MIKKSSNFIIHNKNLCIVGLSTVSLFIITFSVFKNSAQPIVPQSFETESSVPVQADSIAPEVVTEDTLTKYTVPADMPRLLTISKINVRARILHLGLTKDGNIDAPKGTADVGWYNGSVKPGEEGAVFLDGHVSAATEVGGVFVRLKILQAGDTIEIEKGNGEVVRYTVHSLIDKPLVDVDMEAALKPIDGKKGLTIITCAGTYDKATKNFSHRLILYAVQTS